MERAAGVVSHPRLRAFVSGGASLLRAAGKNSLRKFFRRIVVSAGKLRQHFYNVYAYCRISDDLGDEVVIRNNRWNCSTNGKPS